MTPLIRRCATWAEHDWSIRHFVETGRHQTMGGFEKYLVTCTRCGQTTTETRWLQLPPVARRFAAFYEDGRRP